MLIFFALYLIPGSENWANSLVINLGNGQYFNFGFSWIDIVCFTLFIIAAVSDGIDGHIARKRQLITDLGKFLDPFADKFLTDSSLIILCSRKDFSNHNQVVWIFTVIIIARDLLMDGIRMIASLKGRVLAANIYGKIKTASEMIIIPILFLNGFPFSLLPDAHSSYSSWLSNRCSYTYIITNVLIAIVAAFAIISCVIYFIRNQDVLKGDSKDEN